MAEPVSSRRVVVISFLVDVLDVVTNLVVMVLTGSAVVFAEMVQGVADAMGSALLVVGAVLFLLFSFVLLAFFQKR